MQYACRLVGCDVKVLFSMMEGPRDIASRAFFFSYFDRIVRFNGMMMVHVYFKQAGPFCQWAWVVYLRLYCGLRLVSLIFGTGVLLFIEAAMLAQQLHDVNQG